MNRIAPYLHLMRPQQWVKNAFVFVGFVFGHGWTVPGLAGNVLAVFAAFCLVSSAVYVTNDIADREADRRHPEKRMRPLARGDARVGAALLLALALAAAGCALAWRVAAVAGAIAAGYLVLNLAYSAGLKHIAVLDVLLIAAGFMLRILAGTTGVGVAPSHWLFFCGLMLTLFLGFAKRRAELASLADAGARAEQRPALAGYRIAFLDRMVAICAAGAALGYALYSVDPQTVLLHGTNRLIATLPFVVYGLFRYLFLMHRRGGGADPARELLRDPQLLAVTGGWLLVTLWLFAK